MPNGLHIESRPDGSYSIYQLVPVMDHVRPDQLPQMLALLRNQATPAQVGTIGGVATAMAPAAHVVSPAAPTAPAATPTTAERLAHEELEKLLGNGLDIEGSSVRTTDPRLQMIAFQRGAAPTGWSRARAEEWIKTVFAKNRAGGKLQLDRSPYQIHSPRPGITDAQLADYWYFSIRPESQFKPGTERTLTLSNGIVLVVADPDKARYSTLTAKQLAA